MITNINIVQKIKNSGIRPSMHRIEIYDFLINNLIHPTADMVFTALYHRIPTLSKTTVYNTLDLFTEKGLIRQITIDEHEVRYDANTKLHGHFMCLSCRNIYDFSIPDLSLLPKQISDFIITDKSVYYRGICKKCLKKRKQEQ